ncbi:hypothetical protein [Pseudoalteromonas sp. NZS11]|uniref:hypothetical protein n=1 Tax=Pseudoalteromonas sp. NZS11 TaxID=2792049 RepID=UPI0013FD401C|nr:hypothetical protein [Pseudoalteromonas sp. NZS11]MBH0078992.1 hypothetical protein [Pseudoalteromonas sp. NZS11]
MKEIYKVTPRILESSASVVVGAVNMQNQLKVQGIDTNAFVVINLLGQGIRYNVILMEFVKVV